MPVAFMQADLVELFPTARENLKGLETQSIHPFGKFDQSVPIETITDLLQDCCTKSMHNADSLPRSPVLKTPKAQ